MTLPRQVVPGCDYMITRRCFERRFRKPRTERMLETLSFPVHFPQLKAISAKFPHFSSIHISRHAFPSK